MLAGGLAGLGGLVAACGGGNSTPSRSGSHTITVRDQRGDRLVLSEPANRIVTIPMPAASIVIAVDQGVHHLAGMQEESWLAIKDGVLADMFPAALRIPHDVAGDDFAPNVESILALNPDLVVQWADAGAGLISPLSNAGLTVLGVTYGTQQDLLRWLTLFGSVLGKADRSRQMVTRINKDLSRMKAIAAHRSGPAPKIIYFNRFVGGLTVAGADTYNDFYINLIGATNPASTGTATQKVDGMAGVDVEQVLAWDPDIILLGNFDAAMPADVYGNKVWAGVSAVKSHRVYKVPLGGYRWDPPSHESPLMWHWLSQLAFPHPHRSKLRDQIKSYYSFLYGYDVSDAQIDKILWIHANAASAYYSQFHAS